MWAVGGREKEECSKVTGQEVGGEGIIDHVRLIIDGDLYCY